MRNAAGEAVVDAKVIAFYAPTAEGFTTFGITDVVEAKSDEDGRFDLNVLVGCRYSLVATWKDKDAITRQSSLQTCQEGEIISLDEGSDVAGATLDVVVRGDRTLFGIQGDLRATILVDGINRLDMATKLVPASDEAVRFEVPFTMARSTIKILVADDNGVLSRGQAVLLHGNVGKWSTKLATSPELALRVLDAKRQPVTGAFVDVPNQYWGGGAWRVHGQTDAEGIVKLTTASSGEHRWTLRVRKAGFREAFVHKQGTRGHLAGHPFTDWPKQGPIDVVLEASPPVGGRIVDADGKGVAGIPVAMSRDISLSTEKNSYSGLGSDTEVVETDAEGWYRFTAPHNLDGLRVFALLPSAVHARYHRESRAMPTARIDVSVEVLGGKTEAILDLSQLVVHDFVLRRSDGQPARGAAIIDNPIGGSHTRDALDRALRADRRGRVAILNRDPKKARELFAILEGVGWAELPTTASSDAPTEVELTPFAIRDVQCVDSEGKPVEGVRSQIQGSSWSGNSSLLRLAQTVNEVGLSSVSNARGAMRLWSIDVPGLTHNVGFTKANRNAIRQRLPPVGEVWVVTMSN